MTAKVDALSNEFKLQSHSQPKQKQLKQQQKKHKLGKRDEQLFGGKDNGSGSPSEMVLENILERKRQVFEFQDRVDKATLSDELYKLKHRQLNLLNSLNTIAQSINFSPKELDRIENESQKAAQKAIVKHREEVRSILESGGSGGEKKLSKKQQKKLARKKAQQEAKAKGQKLSWNGKQGGKQKQQQRGKQQGGEKGGEINAKELEEQQLRVFNGLQTLQNEMYEFSDSLGIPINMLEKIDPNILPLSKVTDKDIEILNKSLENTLNSLQQMSRELGIDPNLLSANNSNGNNNNNINSKSFSSLKNDQINLLNKLNLMINEAQTLPGGDIKQRNHIGLSGSHNSSNINLDSSDLKSYDSVTTTDSSHLQIRGRRPSMKKDHYPSDTESKEDEIDDTSQLEPISPSHVTSPLISVTNPQETLREAIDVKQRRKSLQTNVKTLRKLLKEYDLSKEGKIDDTSFSLALKNVDIDPEKKNYISKLKIDITSNEDIDYKKFCDFADNPSLTSKLSNHESWDQLRKDLIGAERQEGKLRINYRFDGWPLGQSFQVDSNDPSLKYIDTSKNILNKSIIIAEINQERNDNIPFKEMRYAQIGPTKADKVKWTIVPSNGNVPLRVAKDGWLEADVWLKTEAFMVTKQGIPFPH